MGHEVISVASCSPEPVFPYAPAEDNPPIQQVIDCGVVPYFVQFLTAEQTADLQVEAVSIARCSLQSAYTTARARPPPRL